MIRVVFDKDGFTAQGHAGFDEYGKDVVCAAVSSILQHAAYVLKALGGEMEKGKGHLRVWGVPESECARITMAVTVESLRSIERKYPQSLKVEVI